MGEPVPYLRCYELHAAEREQDQDKLLRLAGDAGLHRDMGVMDGGTHSVQPPNAVAMEQAQADGLMALGEITALTRAASDRGTRTRAPSSA